MVVKCGRKEFELTERDDILFNGVCYQIITQEYSMGFDKYTPKIAKAKAEKMIKDGDLVFDRIVKSRYSDKEMDIYKINSQLKM